MRTPKDFDYDLWTTNEDGVIHYWTRIKATGEVSEVSHDVMKLLRSEEKRMYRELTETPEEGSVLSLDVYHDEEYEYWLDDQEIGVIEMQTAIEEKEFRSLLTPSQLSVYLECLLGGKDATHYGAEHGISRQATKASIEWIRKKAKKYFG